MTPTTPADPSPAAGETLQDRLRLCAQHCQKLYETDEGSEATIQAAAWRLNEAANALDSSRAKTDAMRAERDEANARAEGLEQMRIKIPLTALERAKRTEALEAEVADLKAKLGMAREALASVRAEFKTEHGEDGRLLSISHASEGLRRVVTLLDIAIADRALDARTTLAAIGETK